MLTIILISVAEVTVTTSLLSAIPYEGTDFMKTSFNTYQLTYDIYQYNVRYKSVISN